MSNRRFNWFLILRLAGIALFIIVLSRTDLKALWSWMKQVDRSDLFLAMLFQVLLLMIKAWRWFILNENTFSLNRLKQRSGEFFEGYAMGVITPGRVGELMKAGHAGSRKGILGAGLRVVAERGTDLSLFFLVAGTAMTQGIIPRINPSWGWLVLILGAIGIMMSLMILVSPYLVIQAEKILKWIRMLEKGKSLDFTHFSTGKASGFLLLSVVSNLSYFVCCFFLATGVGLMLPFINISGGVAAAGVINTVPVTVMGLGTREVTFLYVFSNFSQAQVMAFSGLVFFVAQIGGGLFSLILGQILLVNSRLHPPAGGPNSNS